MDKKNIVAIVAGGLASVFFLIFSFSIRTSEIIWLQTRIFGLLSFIFLWIAVMLGELRLLTKIKAKFTLFRFHTPVAIFSMFLVFIHFVSAALDEYKWGVSVEFWQFLGFSFGDKWLVLLSLGTLAFYLMILVGLTSARKSIQFLGFKKWKLVHYLSYLALTIAYIHSMNLGTDLKTSVLAPVMSTVFVIAFLLATSLLVSRVLHGVGSFEDQTEIVLAAVFITALIVGSVFFISSYSTRNERLKSLELNNQLQQDAITTQVEAVNSLSSDILQLRTDIEVIRNGTGG